MQKLLVWTRQLLKNFQEVPWYTVDDSRWPKLVKYGTEKKLELAQTKTQDRILMTETWCESLISNKLMKF